MTLRAVGRLVWFACENVVVTINYFFTAARAPKETQRLERAAWLSRSSRRHLKVFGYSANVSGTLTLPVYKRLGVSFTATDNYLNNPSAGFNKNSSQFVAAATYTLK